MIGFDDDQNIANRAIQAVANRVAVANEFGRFDACSGGGGNGCGVVSRRVIHDQYFIHQVFEVVHDKANGLFFVVGGNDDANLAVLKSLRPHFVLGVVVIVNGVDVEVFAFQIKRAHAIRLGS